MKNYYELTWDDKQKYRKEFNKTTYAIHEMKCASIFSSIAFFAILFSFIFDFILEKEFLSGISFLYIFSMCVAGISFLIATIELIIINHSFKRWMKIKHKVEY